MWMFDDMYFIFLGLQLFGIFFGVTIVLSWFMLLFNGNDLPRWWFLAIPNRYLIIKNTGFNGLHMISTRMDICFKLGMTYHPATPAGHGNLTNTFVGTKSNNKGCPPWDSTWDPPKGGHFRNLNWRIRPSFQGIYPQFLWPKIWY
jgi:hypothetical protein